MKPFSILGLASCLLSFVLPTASEAEEHYIYRNAAGNLVISNQPPPTGSEVSRKLELPPLERAETRPDETAKDREKPLKQ